MSIKKYFKVLLTSIKLQYSSATLDKAAFLMDFGVSILKDFLLPIISMLIYSNTSGVPGWTLPEFILFQGTFLLSFAIAGLGVFSIVWGVGETIDAGLLDRYLVRPLKLVPGFIIGSFNPWFISDTIAGIIIVVIGLVGSGWVFNLGNLLMYILLIISSTTTWFFVASIIVALNFKYPSAYDLLQLFWNIKNLGDYPLTIYGGAIRFLLTFVLPLGLAGFYPTQFILGRITDINMFLVMVIASFAFGVFGYIVLNRSAKNYESVGG